MASPASVLLILLLIGPLLILSLLNDCDATPSETGLLLGWKMQIEDPQNHLRDWTDESPSAPCAWTGIICNGHTFQVAHIDLSNMTLSGTFPPVVGQLSMLRSLNLANNFFSGNIPAEICFCDELQSLALRNNDFTDPLPECFSTLHNLQNLDLSYNHFTHLPRDLGLYPILSDLNVEGCGVVGSIPRAIGNLTSLTLLNLGRNYLTGTIPPELFLLEHLQGISLEYNLIEGRIPPILEALPSLQYLNLAANNLTGSIPSSVGNLTGLTEIYLFNNSLDGTIPVEIGNVPGLAIVDISNNFLSGTIPHQFGKLENLRYLNMSMNSLVGQIPTSLGSLPRLQVLAISSNQLIAAIPQQLGLFSNISVVDLSSNFLVGQIPFSLCSAGSLSSLILSFNFLSGFIPTNLVQCWSLRMLNLSANSLSGNLPHSIGALPNLTHLDLSSNNFTGGLEGARLGDSPVLEKLYLQGNQFFGNLPQHLGDIVNLRTLDLSHNKLSGEIFPEIGKCSNLVQLLLNQNLVSGSIPAEISNSKQLREIDLSGNNLNGNIPVEFEDLQSLVILDLSNNKLNGSIPNQLGKIPSLLSLNLSYNNLSGPVPTNGTFQSMNISVEGNPGLCGGPRNLGLVTCGVQLDEKLPTSTKILVIVLVVLSVLIFAVGHWCYNRESKVFHVQNQEGIESSAGGDIELAERGGREEEVPVVYHDAEARRDRRTDINSQLRVVPSSEVSPVSLIAWQPANWPWKFVPIVGNVVLSEMEILETCAPINLVSTGWSGQKFKGVMQNGRRFLVKKVSGAGTGKNLTKALKTLRQMHHPNIVQILGYCLGGDGGLVAVLHDYLPGGTVSDALHDGRLSRYPCEWALRFEIVVGTARALQYLHDYQRSHSTSPLHSEITSEKIILDGSMKAHLAVRIDVEDVTDHAQTSDEMKGNTPELVPTTCTDSKDVYNLGVVMLQLLTGRRLVDKYTTHIVRWVNEALVVGKTIPDMLDPTMGDHPPDTLRQMKALLDIGCRCTCSVVDTRPSLDEVLKYLFKVGNQQAGRGGEGHPMIHVAGSSGSPEENVNPETEFHLLPLCPQL